MLGVIIVIAFIFLVSTYKKSDLEAGLNNTLDAQPVILADSPAGKVPETPPEPLPENQPGAVSTFLHNKKLIT